MYRIYSNRVKSTAKKKPLAIALFENIGQDKKDTISGFHRNSVKELISKKIVVEFMYADLKRLEMHFFSNEEGLIMSCIRL